MDGYVNTVAYSVHRMLRFLREVKKKNKQTCLYKMLMEN